MKQAARLFCFWGRGKGEKMTVLELISSWTEEERRQHADLIEECLKREEELNDLRVEIRRAEAELDLNLDRLLLGLSDLALSVNTNADQIGNLYLRLVKPQGNA
jgi:hypothetical protein